MCLICIELKKEKLTSVEARSNLKEMHKVIEKDHRIEVLRLIWQKEDEEWEEPAWEDLFDFGSD
tara:strand:- start:300 stop:491 length:192 start_codon:yes stop_codon:yes gene_type:complete